MTGEGAAVCGTPWNGKHRLDENIAVPLRVVCILNRAQDNRVPPLAAAATAKTLRLIDRMAGGVRLNRLDCNVDIEAAMGTDKAFIQSNGELYR